MALQKVVFPASPWSQQYLDVTRFGAKCDLKQVQDAVATSGSAIVTSATANFTSADVGKKAWIINFQNYSVVVKNVTIASVQSATQITLSGNATASSPASPNISTLFWGTDDTAAIQAALTAAHTAAKTTAQEDGAVVFIPASTIISSTLTQYHHTTIKGAGKHVILCAAPDIGAAMIQGDSHARQLGLENITIQGNRVCQGTTPTACHGVVWNTVFSGVDLVNTDESAEARQSIHNIYVRDTAGDGLQLTSESTNVFSDIFVYSAVGRGIVCTIDNYFVNCDVTQCQLECWAILGGNNHFVNCKGNLAGNLTGSVSASGWGWHINPGNIQPNFLSSCDAQDCAMEGYYLDGASNQVMSGCNADSCNNGTSTTHAAIKINNGNFNSITGFVALDRFVGGTPPYGGSHLDQIVEFAGSSGGNYIQAQGYFADSLHFINNGNGGWAGGNTIIINNQLGTETPAYAASVAVNPYSGGFVSITLTGAITLANPVTGHAGCQLTYILTQDATGGRVTSFGTNFHQNWSPTTTANKKNSITFLNVDGTNWVQIASAVGMS